MSCWIIPIITGADIVQAVQPWSVPAIQPYANKTRCWTCIGGTIAPGAGMSNCTKCPAKSWVEAPALFEQVHLWSQKWHVQLQKHSTVDDVDYNCHWNDHRVLLHSGENNGDTNHNDHDLRKSLHNYHDLQNSFHNYHNLRNSHDCNNSPNNSRSHHKHIEASDLWGPIDYNNQQTHNIAHYTIPNHRANKYCDFDNNKQLQLRFTVWTVWRIELDGTKLLQVGINMHSYEPIFQSPTCAEGWAQWDGIGYSGPKCCQDGYACVTVNPYYSGCQLV
ncbi:hypothetical protein M427DRAFT_490956 [Gonapodya prolifera JEL478]|uniref:CBM1 domain-containing protein n=1 Tax=Gonapodya prolifera (strain JEL478) TaxID=1344416 RepID=A0A139AMC4_GONPJ|nr:hypothetical protein M427DRAFT_490956 [Gonapodya prolifera JEL478]|eukprot:KXS17926.1 hypothetical protein M427DRAFT_490956 [Gonapodya prolifera JEL478]